LHECEGVDFDQFSVLLGVVIPPDGGDTMWANPHFVAKIV
jgi:hypothetical protein